MNKRILAAVLWFAALSSLGGFAESFFGVPADLGGYLGIAAAIFVVLDPTGRAWGKGRRSLAHVSSVARTS